MGVNRLRHNVLSWLAQLPNSFRSNRRQFILRTIYLICLVYILVFWRAIWTPDLLFVMFMGLFLLFGNGREFLYRFGPFVVLLLAYDSLRSIVPFITHRVHYFEMIHFDRWLGGGVLPTVRLQQWWWQGHLSWYDYYFYLLYMCHFLFPLLLALLIWRYRPALYNRYILAFLLLSYAGFVTYIIFPAAPPWMASEMGFIPHIHKISTDVWWSVGVHDFPSLYRTLSPNLVAAVPSLHAAYPTMIVLFVTRAFGWRWGLSLIWYPISLWLGIVYMGEHYVFDAIIGILYAIASYLATMWLFKRYGGHARRVQAKAVHHLRRGRRRLVASLRR
jgi:hypothetical protein